MGRVVVGRDLALQVRLLGPVSAMVDGGAVAVGGPRQRRLLAALAMHAGQTVALDTLIDVVWQGDPPDEPVRTFRTYVARLRRALEAAGVDDGLVVVVTDTSGYRLDDAVVQVDAHRAAELYGAAGDHLRAGEAEVAVRLLDEARSLFRGRPFGAFGDEHWAVAEVTRLEELAVAIEERGGEAMLEAGSVGEATTVLEGLAAAHPLRESAVRSLIIARYRAGQHAAALAVARTYREVLAEETGLDASSELERLEQMVLDRDPRLDRAVAGRRLRGYVLREVVAATALGPVHRAEQPSIDRAVRVTVVPPERADDPVFVRAFDAWTARLASVEHPNVLPVYDSWREPGGAFVVTRHVDAGTLADRLVDGPLQEDRVVDLLLAMGGALAQAHERGVQHGALAADAVLLDRAGNPYLAGFDLAVAATTSPEADLRALADLGTAALGPSVDAPHLAGSGLRSLLGRVLSGDDDAVDTIPELLAALRALSSVHVEPWTAALTVASNPYRGLAPFRESDAAAFFGRDRVVDEVDGALRRRGVVALVGPSGTGKSSIVRAGLVPRLRDRGAYVTTMVPGTRPLAELELAVARIAARAPDGLAGALAEDPGLLGPRLEELRPDEHEVVLVVDQAEELFTIADAEERDAFLAAVGSAAGPGGQRLRLVLTLRADFLGAALEHHRAGDLLRGRTVMVTPMTAAELQDAVAAPARAVGMRVDPALVAAVVVDAVHAPRSLPMVQFALTEVFAASVARGEMTLGDYKVLGGIEAVLGQRAEEVFGELDAGGQGSARRLFRRLVTVGPEGEVTRRRALRSDLAVVADDVVDRFAAARLLSFGHEEATREPTVEVTHEALLREWPRLASWVEEERDHLRLLGHLAVAADEWQARGRADDELYRGTRLQAARRFVADRREDLTPTERAFVVASVKADDVRSDRDRRRLSRLRRLVVGLAVAVVAAAGAGLLALDARGDATARADEAEAARRQVSDEAAAADEARLEATRQARDAEMAALVAAGVEAASSSPRLAARLALEAWHRGDTPRTRAGLLAAITAEPRVIAVQGAMTNASCMVPSEGHATFVVRGDAPVIDVRELEGFASVATVDLEGDDETICAVADVANGLVYAMGRTELVALELATGRRIASVPGAFADPQAVRVLPEGQLLTATLAAQGEIAVRRGRDLQLADEAALLGRLQLGAATGQLVPAVSPDGRTVALRTGGTTIEVLERARPATRSTVELGGVPRAFAVTDDGEHVVAFVDGRLQVHVLDAVGEPPLDVRLSAAQDDGFIALSVSPGGLVALLADDVVEVVDPAEASTVAEPVSAEGAFSATWLDDRRLSIGGPGRGTLLVDLESPGLHGVVESWDGPLDLVKTSSDRSSAVGTTDIVSGSWRWVDDEGVARTITSAAEDPGILPITLGPLRGGRVLVVDAPARQFRVRDGDDVTVVPFPDGLPETVAWFRGVTGDDRLVTALLRDPRATDRPSVLVIIDTTVPEIVWSGTVDDGEIVQAQRVGASDVLVFLRPSTLVLVGSDGAVRWRRDTEGATVESMASNADGSRIAYSGQDGTVVVLDGDGERVQTLVGPSPSFVVRIAFVGSQDRLVTDTIDSGFRVWDLSTGQSEGVLVEREDLVPTSGVLDDGALLVSTLTGLVRYATDPSAWQAAACVLADGPLRPEEMAAVLPGASPTTDVGCAAAG